MGMKTAPGRLASEDVHLHAQDHMEWGKTVKIPGKSNWFLSQTIKAEQVEDSHLHRRVQVARK